MDLKWLGMKKIIELKKLCNGKSAMEVESCEIWN
jgi:hypothetical protein